MKNKVIILALTLGIIIAAALGIILFLKHKNPPSSFLKPMVVPAEKELGIKIFPGASFVTKDVTDTLRNDIKQMQLQFVTDAPLKDVQAFYEKELGAPMKVIKENLGEKFARIKEKDPAKKAENLYLAKKFKNIILKTAEHMKDLGGFNKLAVILVYPSYDPYRKDIIKKTDIYIIRTFAAK